ncbi:MAG: hypothetical protein ACJ79D_10850 [Myxococcales bacterium]
MRISSGRPVFRLLGWVLVPLFGAWALWIFAAQVFLLTPLFSAVLNSESPAIHIQYRWAWSVWPGTIHMRGMLLTSQDRKVQWQLGIDRLTTHIVLTEIPRRLFHATKVHADGVSFALRRRIPKYEVTEEKLEGLPRIEGFPDKPLAEEGPDYDTPDWNYRLWSVWLQGVDATGVRQIWVDRLRLEGGAHLAGAFYLKPTREVLIDPAVIEGTRLAVADGPARVWSDLHLALRVKIGPIDPRGMQMETFARAVDADVEAKGNFEGLAAVQHFFPGERLSGGAGPMALSLHVQAGQVLPPTSFAAELSRLVFRHGRVGVTARTLSAWVQVPPGPPPIDARLWIDLQGISTAGARTASVVVALDDLPRDLARIAPPRRVSIDVRGGRIEDAKSVAEALGVRDRVEQGQGTFSAHLEGPPDHLSGDARVALKGVRATAASATLLGDVAVDLKVRALDPSRGADLSGTRIAVDSGRAIHDSGEEDTAPEWWGRIELPRVELRFGAKEDAPVADADLRGRCRDARPIVGLYARAQDLPGFVRGLFGMDGLTLRGSAIAGRSWMSLREIAADGDHASVHAVLRADPGGSRGAALLSVRGLSLGVELSPSGKSLHPIAAGSWYGEQVAQLDPGKALGALPRARREPPRRRPVRVQTAE